MLYVLSMLRTCFRVNPNSVVAWMSRCDIWSLSDCNGARTNNHLVCKRTHNHLAELAKWLSCVVSTYLYRAFDCMFFSCHLSVSECIHIPYSVANNGLSSSTADRLRALVGKKTWKLQKWPTTFHKKRILELPMLKDHFSSNFIIQLHLNFQNSDTQGTCNHHMHVWMLN